MCVTGPQDEGFATGASVRAQSSVDMATKLRISEVPNVVSGVPSDTDTAGLRSGETDTASLSGDTDTDTASLATTVALLSSCLYYTCICLAIYLLWQGESHATLWLKFSLS